MGASLGAAVDPNIKALQQALTNLGAIIGDKSVQLTADGVIGPATAAAVNRAFTVHIGSGQAPAQFRTGALSQADISANANALIQLVTAEVTRRTSSSSGLPTASGNLSAPEALAQIVATYKALQLTAGSILTAYKGQTFIACEVRTRYQTAVQAYRTAAGTIFNQLAAKGYTPVQFLMDDSGNFLLDANGQARSVQVQSPLLPTMFDISDCPSTNLTGLLGSVPVPVTRVGHHRIILPRTPPVRDSGLGILPLAAAGVCLTGPFQLAGCIALAGVAGFILYETAKAIIVNWPTAANQTIAAQKAWLDNHISCLATAQAKGLPATSCDVDQSFKPSAVPPPKTGWGMLEYIGLGTVLLGVGVGAYYLIKRQRAGLPFIPSLPSIPEIAHRVFAPAPAQQAAMSGGYDDFGYDDFGDSQRYEDRRPRARGRRPDVDGVPATFKGCLCF